MRRDIAAFLPPYLPVIRLFTHSWPEETTRNGLMGPEFVILAAKRCSNIYGAGQTAPRWIVGHRRPSDICASSDPPKSLNRLTERGDRGTFIHKTTRAEQVP
jgi:hypothetical protein